MIEIELPDGTILEAPDNADVSAVAKNYMARQQQTPAYNPTEGMSGGEKFLVGMGKAFADLGRGARQVFDASNAVQMTPELQRNDPEGYEYMAGLKDKSAALQSEIDESRKLDAPLMASKNEVMGMDVRPAVWGNVTGNIAASLPAAFVPGANLAAGSAAAGGLLGALQPTTGDESRLTNTALGAGAGLAGFGVGKLANKAVSSAAKRVGLIESKVAAKAAADAASETASARSAAGNAAQNAYRQLEHLRELKAMGLLTPEQKLVAEALEKELAGKAAEKLLPAAAQKEATAKLFKELTETESERAARLATERLSNKEIKSQAMARWKRYWPGAVGAVLGHALFPGIGGAAGGFMAGIATRPSLRSMVNLAKNPAVQHKLLSPVANSGLLGNPHAAQTLGLLGPSIYAGQQ